MWPYRCCRGIFWLFPEAWTVLFVEPTIPSFDGNELIVLRVVVIRILTAPFRELFRILFTVLVTGTWNAVLCALRIINLLEQLMASSFSQEFANFVFFLVFDLFSISSYTRLSTLKLKFFLINNLKLYRGYIVEPLAWLGQASFDSNKIKIGVKFSLLWIVSINSVNAS